MQRKENNFSGNPEDIHGTRKTNELGQQSDSQDTHKWGSMGGNPFGNHTGSNLSSQFGTNAGQTGQQIGSQMGQQTGSQMGQHSGQQGYQMGQTLGSSIGTQTGQQMGQRMGGQIGQQIGGQMGQPMGGQIGQQIGGQMGQPMGGQIGQQIGGQMGQPMGGQIGQQMGEQMGQRMGGQMGQQIGQTGQQSQWAIPKFGAPELMMVHEVLTDHIDGINQFELYKPHVKDQALMQILDSQINHMYNSYQNVVNYLHNQGMGSAAPYRAPKSSSVKYGLRQPSPVEPNTDVNAMDDRDVASGMMGCAKASAVLCANAALECADQNLRSMMTNCTVSAINQAYELFQYMNQKGMYQIPTLTEQTTQTIMNTYQTGSRPMFQ